MSRLFKVSLMVSLVVGAFSVPVLAGPSPCDQVKAACLGAGFVNRQWKKGFGLHRDCVNPIMQGVTNPPGAVKPLPTVDPGVVSACRTMRPKFGEGKVGSN